MNFEEYNKKYIKDNLQKLGYKYDIRNVFQDFVMSCAYSFVLANKEDEFIEKSYHQIISKYTKEEVTIITNMFIGLLLENNKDGEFEDILGTLYEEFGLSNHNLGQFFTPMSICNLMTDIVVDKDSLTNHIEKIGYYTFSDPACGSGRTMFSFLQ